MPCAAPILDMDIDWPLDVFVVLADRGALVDLARRCSCVNWHAGCWLLAEAATSRRRIINRFVLLVSSMAMFALNVL